MESEYVSPIDCKLLIQLVKSNGILWDTRDKSYHNKKLTKELWKEIAKTFNTTHHLVTKKWRNLRDTYRKHYFRLKDILPIIENDSIAKWEYYDDMAFLNDILVQRKNIRIEAEPSVEFKKCDVRDDHNTSSQLIIHPPPPNTTAPNPRIDAADNDNGFSGNKTSVNDLKLKYVEISHDHQYTRTSDSLKKESQMIPLLRPLRKKQKINRPKPVAKFDDDYHFLMSIIPHLVRIPKYRKLFVRNRIQNVIIEEMCK